MHKKCYNNFTTENVIEGIRNYLFKNGYTTSSCDVAFVGICNAINTVIISIVHQAQADGTFMKIRHPPRCPSTAPNHEVHELGRMQDLITLLLFKQQINQREWIQTLQTPDYPCIGQATSQSCSLKAKKKPYKKKEQQF